MWTVGSGIAEHELLACPIDKLEGPSVRSTDGRSERPFAVSKE